MARPTVNPRDTGTQGAIHLRHIIVESPVKSTTERILRDHLILNTSQDIAAVVEKTV
jgi:hypothetical protein